MDFRDVFVDETGYAELKKHMRQVTEFTNSTVSILQERADIETTYAKSLAKLSSKAQKCNKDATGSLMASWNVLCQHFREESENHKVAADSLHEDVHKRLKVYCETHVKSRKSAESIVDKSCKAWHDKRSELLKAKKATYTKAKENEGVQAVLDDPYAKGKVLSDKELGKLHSKSKKLDEAASRADTEYLQLIKATERARHEFEVALRQAATALEKLETERIREQKIVLESYVGCFSTMQPKTQKTVDNMSQAIQCIVPENDVMVIAQHKGRQREHVEQVLYDPYEEDLSHNMTLNRRRQSLQSKLKTIDVELEKEKKAKDGIARLSGAYAGNASYADTSTQDVVVQQLTHSEEMLNMLRACKFKITAALALVDKKPKPQDDISPYIKTEKDKQQGVHVSVLKMPRAPPSSGVTEVDSRGMGDGANHLQAITDEDEGNNNEWNEAEMAERVICQCVVKFNYEAQEDGEISVQEGQIINVVEKHDDGWWYGECNGQRGNFPGSYVDLL
ncbi:nostrin-like [Asterias rubens]|uniref:nostrin-like n=1 Tax=Asterias rubens TaxID=7604 RepID=UPI001455C6E6|nr:nostrin-like [Asterias rubens]